jgi:hypothetical protein
MAAQGYLRRVQVFYNRLTGIDPPRRASGFADSARDAFLYLLSFDTLTVWTIGLGSLFFRLIGVRPADPVSGMASSTFGIRLVSVSGSMASCAF